MIFLFVYLRVKTASATLQGFEKIMEDELSQKSTTCRTYKQWKENRETLEEWSGKTGENWRKLIEKKMFNLSHRIEVTDDLFNKLRGLEVFQNRAIGNFKATNVSRFSVITDFASLTIFTISLPS